MLASKLQFVISLEHSLEKGDKILANCTETPLLSLNNKMILNA